MDSTSEEIVKRLEKALIPWKDHLECKRMFGGSCFLYKGKMCVGETKKRLVVRVIPEKMSEVLKMPFVSPMDFTGTPMKEFVFVEEGGYHNEETLQFWVELGIEHALTKSS